MDTSLVMPLLTAIGILFFLLPLGILAFFKAFYVKIEQGKALIVNDRSHQPKVYFTGAMVLPVFHKKEIMKISVITLEIDRRGHEGLICKDNLRADITVAFYLRVNETAADVLKVAKTVTVERASNREAVNQLFNAKFSEALKTVGMKMEFLELFENRIQFRDQIIKVIGDDLNGYILEDVAIDYLEQTPKSLLDSNNIQDAEGIRKITELTAGQNVQTNQLERDEELAVKRKNVATKEAMLELEKQQADAEARQQREINSIQAREEAETTKVVEEEKRKAEEARITSEEAIAVAEVNRQRQVEIAQKNRERAIAIENEKVNKARFLEIVNREREVELQEIEKEKALEEERKIIAHTVSERIAVDKKVAEEEERIKDVRKISEAERQKQVMVIDAEAQAQEELVKQVKAAEAEEYKATHKAKEIAILAQAHLESAAKEAEAKIKASEGLQAEEAALGLAEARVMEAKAQAVEKEGRAKANAEEATGLARVRVLEAQAQATEQGGLADAKVLEEKLVAQAKGDEAVGLAEATAEREKGLSIASVMEAKAKARELEGLADAKVLEEKLLAQAKGDEAIGTAVATAERDKGLAEAEIIREKAKAEADGLSEKFNAMGNMSPEAREFEEFRMKLDVAYQEAMASIEANKEVSKDQALVLSKAMEKAKIEIIGGDGDYFQNFAKALSLGNTVNGLVEKSPMVGAALSKLLSLGAGGAVGGTEAKVKTDKA